MTYKDTDKGFKKYFWFTLSSLIGACIMWTASTLTDVSYSYVPRQELNNKIEKIYTVITTRDNCIREEVLDRLDERINELSKKIDKNEASIVSRYDKLDSKMDKLIQFELDRINKEN